MNEKITENPVNTILVDDVCLVLAVGGVTHIVFTQREPETDGKTWRSTQVPLVVPNNCVPKDL